jgi:DNA-binding CsgD family transcriptional regulator
MNSLQPIRRPINHKPLIQSESRLDKDNCSDDTDTHFYLGTQHKGVYLTRREAQCVFYLLKGCTIKDVAKQLKLSPRTVEFYVKNMRLKTGADSKTSLIDIIIKSDIPCRLHGIMDSIA